MFYWILFLILFSCFVFINAAFSFGLCAHALKTGDEKSDHPFCMFIFVFLTVFITGPITYNLLHWINLYPPGCEASSTSPEKLSESAISLIEKSNSLQELLKSPDELKLAELPAIAQEVSDLTKELQIQSEQQEKIIRDLEKDVEDQTERAAEAERIAEDIRSMTKEQVDAVKFLITEDAKTASSRSFYYGLAFSFPLGILASFIATIVIRRLDS